MKKDQRLTVADVVDGWSVRIVRKDRSTFIASGPTPTKRAFFTKHADARTFVRDLRAHELRGRIVRARLILQTA